MSNIDKFKRIVENRVRTAMCWHGLSDVDDIADFVASDADVDALFDDDAALQAAAEKHLIQKIIEGRDLDRIRKALGDDFVDTVLALAVKARTEN